MSLGEKKKERLYIFQSAAIQLASVSFWLTELCPEWRKGMSDDDWIAAYDLWKQRYEPID